MIKQRVESSDALSALIQLDSPGPGVAVVKVFTNLPYLLWGSFHSPCLDVTSISAGTSTIYFPLALLCLHMLPLYSSTQVILPCKREGYGLKVYPFLLETLWESSEEEHLLSHPVPLSVPPYLIQIEMWACRPLMHLVWALPLGNYRQLPRPRLSLN